MGVLTTVEIAKKLSELFIVKEFSSDLQSRGKNLLKDQISKHKEATQLKDILEKTLETKRAQNENATLDEEIDFQGLCNYLLSDIFVQGFRSFLSTPGSERTEIKSNLLYRAEKEAKGKSPKANERAREITEHIFDALESFFRNQIPQSVLIVSGEIEQEVESAKESLLSKIENVPIAVTRQIAEDAHSELHEYLYGLLIRTRNDHPSFKLMGKDALDERLFPGVEAIHHFTPCGSKKGGGHVSPVWDIIEETWSEPVAHNIVIEGGGGIGKTVTLLSVTAREDGRPKVPALYVPLFDLVDDEKSLSLTEYLDRRLPERKDAICLLAAHSAPGPSLLLLLDGFNEIPAANRMEILEKLRQWQIDHPGVQYIAVSRPLDGLDLAGSLGEGTIAIELAPLERYVVQEYLQDCVPGKSLPRDDSNVWDFLGYPMFLTLYIKAAKLKTTAACAYSLAPRETDGPGGIIWNYLQRELLRIRSEKWVVRCAVACEYLLPRVAYEMVKKHRFTIEKEDLYQLVQDMITGFNPTRVPDHIDDVFAFYEERHPGSYPRLKDYNLMETILQETGLIVEHQDEQKKAGRRSRNKRYAFLHQNFRDCLAGVYLLNRAEMAEKDELPEIWKQIQSDLALSYVAELIKPEVLESLWEANRKAVQYDGTDSKKNHIATCNLLELYRRNDALRKELDFSGMDLRGLSLTRYLGKGGPALPLFRHRLQSRGTHLDHSVFESAGHSCAVTTLASLSDGRLVSGSYDNTLRVWDAATEQCLQILKGHTAGITCLAVLPEGQVVSGSRDSSLRIWNAETGECLQTLTGHTASITCLAVLPEGRVVSGSHDNTLRVWNAASGQCLQILEGHKNSVSCLAVLPEGQIVSGSWDLTLMVWDTTAGQCLRTLVGHKSGVTCVSVLSEGQVVSGSHDNTLRVWDAATGECLQTLRGHGGVVNCMTVLSNGQVVSGSDDQTLRIWNTISGKCVHILEGHRNPVKCLDVLLDGRVVSAAWGNVLSQDNTLRIWDPGSGKCLQTLAGQSYSVDCLTLLPEERIVGGAIDGTLQVWNIASSQCPQSLGGREFGINCLALSQEGCLVSGTTDKTLRIWDPSSGKCLQALEGHLSPVNRIALLPKGLMVSGAAGLVSQDNTLRVWDTATGQCLHTLEVQNRITCLVILPEGRVVSGSWNGTLSVWRAADGQCLRIIEGYNIRITCLVVLRLDRIVSGHGDGTLQVLDATSGCCLRTLKGHTGEITCLAVLPNGRLVSGSNDNTLRVWNATSGRCLRTLKGHTGEITCLAVLPDGRLVSGSNDNTLRVWNATSGRCLRTLKEHTGEITCLAVLPDGRLVSGSNDNSLRVWNPDTNQCQRTLEGHTSPVTCVAVLLNGRVVSGSDDNTLRVWDPDTGGCLDVFEGMEVRVAQSRVFQMDFSDAILTDGLARLLWHNSAVISGRDYQRWVAPFRQQLET